jgi:hypothetical protein
VWRGDDCGLTGVIQRGPNELANMVVRERVVDVLAFATALHDALGVQHAKLLGERGKLGLARVSELGDAALARVEPTQETKASEIACGPKERCGALERRVTHLRDMGALRSMGAAVLLASMWLGLSFQRLLK